MEEIKYPIIEEYRRDILCEYKQSPEPNHLGKGGKEKDIAGLKPKIWHGSQTTLTLSWM